MGHGGGGTCPLSLQLDDHIIKYQVVMVLIGRIGLN